MLPTEKKGSMAIWQGSDLVINLEMAKWCYNQVLTTNSDDYNDHSGCCGLNYICWLAIELCIVLVSASVQCNINWAFMFGAIEWHVINTWYRLAPSFHYFKSSNLCDRKPFAICTNLHLMYFAICEGWCWWRQKETSVFLCRCSIGVKKWKYSHFARCFTVRIEECGRSVGGVWRRTCHPSP